MFKKKLLINFSFLIMASTCAVAGELNTPPRSLTCEILEFSELDSLNKTELESYYCGNKLADAVSAKLSEEKPDDNIDIKLFKANTRLNELMKCQSANNKIIEIYVRKYSSDKISCSNYKGFDSDGNPKI